MSMEPTNQREALQLMRQMVAGLPTKQQAIINDLAGKLRAFISQNGPLAQMAIGIVGAELAIQAEEELPEEWGVSTLYKGEADPRYVYGTMCFWHGPISAAGSLPVAGSRVGGIPCCPYCGGTLYEMPSKVEWDAYAKAIEERGATNYLAFTEWVGGQKRCFKTLAAAGDAYRSETGKEVKLPG